MPESTLLPPQFAYKNNQLWLEQVNLAEVAAQVGTPTYVYSAGAIRENYQTYTHAFKEAGLKLQLCYALKACSNLAVVGLLAKEGAGADVVSGGELYRALKAGVTHDKIVFAGVGKTVPEIDMALKTGVKAFNVESEAELYLIEQRAMAVGLNARVSFRLNPNVEAHTHHYITTGRDYNKFGLSPELVKKLAKYATKSPHLWLVGVQCHIGSQLLEIAPLGQAVAVLANLALEIEQENNIMLEYLDIGGGLGIAYNQREEQTASPVVLAQTVAAELAKFKRQWSLVAEPGRWMVGNAGVLLTQTLYLKENDTTRFAIIDAAMNDLIRPALYQAYHEIIPLKLPADAATLEYEVVGPVCESADFLAHGRQLPIISSGDYLAVLGAGAYSFSMSSNYNSRGRAAEVLVENNKWRVIRPRETYEDLIRTEALY
jgi:diaminopimelate decarboxylase